MAEHTITSVKWTNLSLEEVLVVTETAHRSKLPDVTTWTRESDVRMIGSARRYDVDTDSIDVETIGTIDKALNDHRENREQAAAQLGVPRG